MSSSEVPPTPVLLVRIGGAAHRLSPGARAVVGRDPGCDIVVGDERVSRRQAELHWAPVGWIIRDLDSANGTWMGGHRITETVVSGTTVISLGAADGVQLELSVGAAASVIGRAEQAEAADASDPTRLGQLTSVHSFGSSETAIGRNPDCEVVVDDFTVSRRHAVIRRDARGFEIVDLGSTNGTFVNGQSIERTRLENGDVISVGGHVFRFSKGQLSEYSASLGAWLCAMGIWVRVPTHRSLKERYVEGIPPSETTLLVDIGFAVGPSTLLGIVGPSGAGKTTLLKALTGQQPAGLGRVLYGGRDLYAALDLRRRMGYVPQEDLLHPQLTVREALDYAAELRFAADVDKAARAERVDQVMRELGLDERASLPVAQLSGGQRKRTSIAAELLTRPSLLFLDEPTSGLDPGHEENVTALLRKVADEGRTVVTATHSLVTLERCDRVLFLARGGRLAYFGPPSEAIDYFRSNRRGATYPVIFAALEGDGETFESEFRRNPRFGIYVQEPLARAVNSTDGDIEEAGSQTRSDHLRQFSVLVRRYAAVLRADRTSTLLLAAQAPFFALLFAILYSNNIMKASSASEATILVWLMVVGATWMGTSNAIREIVKEFPIIKRERGLGLSLGAYLASKLTVLSVITVVQCSFLAVATMLPQHLPALDNMSQPAVVVPSAGALIGSQSMELVIDIVLVGLASMAVGLLLSALVRNPDQANFALPLVLVAQVVLSAPTLASPSLIFAALGLPATAQWGTAAAASTLSLNTIRKPSLTILEHQRSVAENDDERPDVAQGRANWNHDSGVWLVDSGALLLITLASLGVAYVVLKRRIDGPSPTIVRSA